MSETARPTNNWGDGDLPAPYAPGDIIHVPAGAKALQRMHGIGPGDWPVESVWSIDEGDAWYVRLTGRVGRRKQTSDRLHVAYAGRSSMPAVDWLEGCTLVITSDIEGLARRERMLAAGWTMPERYPTDGELLALIAAALHDDGPPAEILERAKAIYTTRSPR